MLCKEWLNRQLFSGDLIPTCFQNLTVFDSSESLLKSPIKMNGRKVVKHYMSQISTSHFLLCYSIAFMTIICCFIISASAHYDRSL